MQIMGPGSNEGKEEEEAGEKSPYICKDVSSGQLKSKKKTNSIDMQISIFVSLGNPTEREIQS